jgi:signal transduction histidine kinase
VALAFGAFAVVDLAAILLDAEPVTLYVGVVVVPALLYPLARWGSGRDVVLGTAVAAVGFAVTVTTTPTAPGDVVGGAGLLLSAAALGLALRFRALERLRLVEQAKLQEREQLARELHDTVAHHVSAIAVQAQAGLVLARSATPGGATEALELIDQEAARTLAEMRAIVGALRHERSSPPGGRLADIAGLAATGADSLRVDVALRGELTDLPPAVEAALYRVAQESVTNARRHAQLATRVEVTVSGGATDVQLTVRDDGAGGPPPSDVPGYGLVGMAERVSLLGGTLDAGPGPDRGWQVRAVLPRPRGAT